MSYMHYVLCSKSASSCLPHQYYKELPDDFLEPNASEEAFSTCQSSSNPSIDGSDTGSFTLTHDSPKESISVQSIGSGEVQRKMAENRSMASSLPQNFHSRMPDNLLESDPPPELLPALQSRSTHSIDGCDSGSFTTNDNSYKETGNILSTEGIEEKESKSTDDRCMSTSTRLSLEYPTELPDTVLEGSPSDVALSALQDHCYCLPSTSRSIQSNTPSEDIDPVRSDWLSKLKGSADTVLLTVAAPDANPIPEAFETTLSPGKHRPSDAVQPLSAPEASPIPEALKTNSLPTEKRKYRKRHSEMYLFRKSKRRTEPLECYQQLVKLKGKPRGRSKNCNRKEPTEISSTDSDHCYFLPSTSRTIQSKAPTEEIDPLRRDWFSKPKMPIDVIQLHAAPEKKDIPEMPDTSSSQQGIKKKRKRKRLIISRKTRKDITPQDASDEEESEDELYLFRKSKRRSVQLDFVEELVKLKGKPRGRTKNFVRKEPTEIPSTDQL